jgi:hypothetical protein
MCSPLWSLQRARRSKRAPSGVAQLQGRRGDHHIQRDPPDASSARNADPDYKHEHERGRRKKDKDLITQAKHRATEYATEYGDNCECEHTTSPPVMTGASTLSPDDIKLFERRLVPGTLWEPQRAAVIVPNVKGARPFERIVIAAMIVHYARHWSAAASPLERRSFTSPDWFHRSHRRGLPDRQCWPKRASEMVQRCCGHPCPRCTSRHRA